MIDVEKGRSNEAVGEIRHLLKRFPFFLWREGFGVSGFLRIALIPIFQNIL